MVVCLVVSFIMKKDIISEQYEKLYGRLTDIYDVNEHMGMYGTVRSYNLIIKSRG